MAWRCDEGRVLVEDIIKIENVECFRINYCGFGVWK